MEIIIGCLLFWFMLAGATTRKAMKNERLKNIGYSALERWVKR